MQKVVAWFCGFDKIHTSKRNTHRNETHKSKGNIIMAYVSKEMKAELVAAVKKVLPADWKATFKVENYSKNRLCYP